MRIISCLFSRYADSIGTSLINIKYDQSAVYISFSINFPIPVGRSTIGRIYNFGTITKNNSRFIRRKAVLNQRALVIDNRPVEISENDCPILKRRISVCKKTALLFDSCLAQPSACRYEYVYTDNSCTVMNNDYHTCE